MDKLSLATFSPRKFLKGLRSSDIHIYRVLRIGEITVVSVNRISFIRGSIKPVIVYSIQSYKTGSINHVTRSIE